MKSLCRSVVGLAIAAGLTGGAFAAPASYGGSEYDIIVSEGITWTAANAAANAMGSGWRLATITSAAEDGFVAALLGTSWANRSHFWIGATDVAVESNWVWGTGESFTYANWAVGEPNNSGNEDYLAYDLREVAWAFNDAPDNVGSIYGFARGYVIERAVSTDVPEPGTLSLLGLALGLTGWAARRRRRA